MFHASSALVLAPVVRKNAVTQPPQGDSRDMRCGGRLRGADRVRSPQEGGQRRVWATRASTMEQRTGLAVL